MLLNREADVTLSFTPGYNIVLQTCDSVTRNQQTIVIDSIKREISFNNKYDPTLEYESIKIIHVVFAY